MSYTRAQLTASGVTIARGGTTVLRDVGMAVSPRSRWCVVGENGRGKSTLLQLLAGTLEPDAGTVQRFGTIGVAEQELSAAGGRTVGDVIDAELAGVRAVLRALDDTLTSNNLDAYAAALGAAERMGAWDADRRVDVALAALGAVSDRGRRLAELSVGQRYRVRLACLLGAGHDFLLLDEPTNHLDLAGITFLTGRLRAYPGGVVLVSHDRALLADVATTILDLDPSRDGRPRVHGGGFAGYQEGRRAERARWAEEYEQQRAEQARLAESLEAAQGRLVDGWRPGKGHGKHARATRAPGLVQSVHRRRDDLERHAVTMPPPPQRFAMPELPVLPGTVLLRAEEVTVGGRLAEPVSLELVSGSRLVVSGPNGAGKSTLLAVLAGRLAPDGGTVRVARTAVVGFLEQEPPYAVQPVLSPGQRRRRDLAAVLAGRPHVLLLDEPTNHLSIALVDELTEALAATGAAVVIATHDRQLTRDTAGWPRLELAQSRVDTSL